MRATRIITGMLLIGLLLVGGSIFRDFGLHWDEYHNQGFGKRNVEYVRSFLKQGGMAEYRGAVFHDWVHGPAFEILLRLASEASGLDDPRDVVFMRHCFVFLAYWVGAIGLVFFIRRFFPGREWPAPAALAVYVLHPHLFAHAFFNSVDTVFMVSFLLSLLTMLRFFEKPNFARMSLHALTTALSTDVRLIGGVVALATVIGFFHDALCVRPDRFGLRGRLMLLAGYCLMYLALVYLFWPLLWAHPFANTQKVFSLTRHISDDALEQDWHPWYYLLRWIFLTTPVLFSSLSLAGSLSFFMRLVRPREESYSLLRNFVLVSFCCGLPLILQMMWQTRVYDGWRHFFFLYPFIVLLAVEGGSFLYSAFFRMRARFLRRTLLIFFWGSMVWTAVTVAHFMVVRHPHQLVYGNVFAGPYLERVRYQGSNDNWGLSYRCGYEFLLRSDPRPVIRVRADNRPGRNSIFILSPQERARIVLVEQGEADYFITNLRKSGRPKFPSEIVFRCSIGKNDYLRLYRMGRKSRGPKS